MKSLKSLSATFSQREPLSPGELDKLRVSSLSMIIIFLFFLALYSHYSINGISDSRSSICFQKDLASRNGHYRIRLQPKSGQENSDASDGSVTTVVKAVSTIAGILQYTIFLFFLNSCCCDVRKVLVPDPCRQE